MSRVRYKVTVRLPMMPTVDDFAIRTRRDAAAYAFANMAYSVIRRAANLDAPAGRAFMAKAERVALDLANGTVTGASLDFRGFLLTFSTAEA